MSSRFACSSSHRTTKAWYLVIHFLYLWLLLPCYGHVPLMNDDCVLTVCWAVILCGIKQPEGPCRALDTLLPGPLHSISLFFPLSISPCPVCLSHFLISLVGALTAQIWPVTFTCNLNSMDEVYVRTLCKGAFGPA